MFRESAMAPLSRSGSPRPPFLFPPFLPFSVPPPQPPPNFSGMSTEELRELEGNERNNVEARIRCLRNIQVRHNLPEMINLLPTNYFLRTF